MKSSVFLITPLLQTKTVVLDMTADGEVNHRRLRQGADTMHLIKYVSFPSWVLQASPLKRP